MADHVHMLISIPPKYAVADVIGFIKGKSTIHIARALRGRKNVRGEHFWARGYFASTVGRDEQDIREYIRQQEKEDMRLDQIRLLDDSSRSRLQAAPLELLLCAARSYMPSPLVGECDRRCVRSPRGLLPGLLSSGTEPLPFPQEAPRRKAVLVLLCYAAFGHFNTGSERDTTKIQVGE
jgi:hypothetical protein